MTRIFKTKNFQRWMKRERIPDRVLCNAIDEIKQGLVDVDLGGGLIKKRVARQGAGKRGGYRTLIAFRNLHYEHAFLYMASRKTSEII